ncbi:hypothetical protein BD410DRAFT_607992 [Rickenella mellea]|uniref:Uncharacterized protein n=1 Tax=Rickenella mellea TaxID=50990 RepID=A0A4Y7QFZ5_9AGAM|nr:hypothetical protein BD410DRAFT_607992 [Rickenella mellea]
MLTLCVDFSDGWDPPPPGAAADAAAPPQNPPPPGPGAAPQVIAPPAHVRSPLRELSEPPDMFPNGNMDYDDDEDELPRKRRVPNPTPNSNVPPPSEPPATGTTLVPSPYFGSNMASSSRTRVESSQLSRVLSPTRREPIVIEDDSSMEVDLLDVQTRASTQVPNTQRTSGKAGVVEPSSDFDYGDIDDAFLAEVEQVERQAIDAEVTASQTRVSRGTTPAVAHPPLQSRVAGHVITIDDEDEDDKENVPLPKRRVRRRLVGESGVIDISD